MHFAEWLPATKLNIVTAHNTVFMIFPATITSNLTTISISLFCYISSILYLTIKHFPELELSWLKKWSTGWIFQSR